MTVSEFSELTVNPAKTMQPYKKSERTNVFGSAFGTALAAILCSRCALAAAMDRESKLAAAESLYIVYAVLSVCVWNG